MIGICPSSILKNTRDCTYSKRAYAYNGYSGTIF